MLIPDGSDAQLQDCWHGKARVRVAKVIRRGAHHDFVEYTVEIKLFGGSSSSFTHGVNEKVVATDTCRNHVYMLAKTHACDSAEAFSLDLARKFLATYPWLSQVLITVSQRPWRRASVASRDHSHGFTLRHDGTRHACARIEKGIGADPDSVLLVSGLHSLSVLKTTQSGWAGFVQDRYTTLPETDERILATTISAEWTYAPRRFEQLRGLAFDDVHRRVRDRFLSAFYGPPDKGQFSPGVQHTLYLMAKSAVDDVQDIEHITVSLPNLHFLPCTLPVFAKNGVAFDDDVYVPSDEPHGIISATVARRRMSKL